MTYKYLGDFSATPPWHSRHMECHECEVSWTGCWDNFQCPKCGQGDLPTNNSLEDLILKLPPKEEIYQASVVPYRFYNELSKIPQSDNNLGKFFGLEIVPLASMPEDEALMFRDKKDAYNFVNMVERFGYKNAKMYANILLKITNIGQE